MADTGAVLRKMLALGSPHFLRTTSGKMYTGRVTEVGDSFVVVCIEESAASQRAGQRSEVSIPIGDVDVQSLGYWHATRRQRASVLLSLSSAELDRARAVMEAFDAVASSHHPTRQSIGLKDGDYCAGWIAGIEGDTVWFWGSGPLADDEAIPIGLEEIDLCSLYYWDEALQRGVHFTVESMGECASGQDPATEGEERR